MFTLSEVYVVGQLHIDIFELTELPDMALSNRQGYKTDDPRYQAVLEYVRNTLLPDILKMRDVFVSLGKKKKEEEKLEQQRQKEASFKESVDKFRKTRLKKLLQEYRTAWVFLQKNWKKWKIFFQKKSIQIVQIWA